MLPTELIKQSADLVLMPHSAPDMSGSGGLPQPPGTRLASWYAKKLGIPVAMENISAIIVSVLRSAPSLVNTAARHVPH